MIKPVSEIDTTAWRELIKVSPFASYFQSPEFYQFYSTLSFLKVFGWAVFDHQGTLQGLVCGYTISNGRFIKRYCSARAIIQGGLLLRYNIDESLVGELLQRLKNELSKTTIYIEIRNSHDYSKYKKSFAEYGFSYKPHLNYLISTKSSIENIRAKYDRDRRRECSRALDSGLKAKISKNIDDMEAFYEILSEAYRKKIKKPLFDREFFLKTLDNEEYRLLIIKQNGEVIGGNMFIIYDNVLYGLFLASKNNTKLHSSVLLIDSAIEFACSNQIHTFDFMGAGTPDRPYGVRNFKGKFGGNMVEFGRFLCINKKIIYLCAEKIINMRIRWILH